MARAPRKDYPNDFRIKVAKEAQESPVPEVAKKFKLPENSVYNWRATFRKFGEAGFVGPGKRGPVALAAKPKGNGALKLPSVLSGKTLEKAAGQALSGLVGKAVASLKAQVETEQKLRLAAERKLQAIQKIMRG